MTREETTGKDNRCSHIESSQDGRFVLRLSELAWETEFFSRRFGRLEIEGKGAHDVEASAIVKALRDTLSLADENGFDVIEAQLDMSWIHRICLFESNGFRLVDTKLRFLTPMTHEGMDDLPAPEGDVGFASADMKEEILSLTQSAFTNNPSFKSRFNNERFFTKSDTERYYAAWIENYLGSPNTLFVVVREEGKVVGYLVYTQTGEHKGKPLYKAALIAVDPEYRGRRIYFAMRSFVYRHFPVDEAYLDMTTQLSNLSTIRNLVKARRNLDSTELVFYRRRKDRTPNLQAERPGMTRTLTTSENGGSACVRSSQDGSLLLRLSELAWETEFFGRRFGRLGIDEGGIENFDTEALDKPLQELLSIGDQYGYDLIELELDVSWIHRLFLFEDRGFRLVDTKLRFLTLKKKEEMHNLPPPTRETCLASEDMKGEILDLTRRAFTTNPSFQTRFNNEDFFSRSETERYYAAWIENYMGDRNALFAVTREEGRILGYLIYTKSGEHKGKPLYKDALMVVDPEYRGRRVYFDLRSFVHPLFPEPEVYLDTTTQLSNLSKIRNLIKTQETVDNIWLVFYRKAFHPPL